MPLEFHGHNDLGMATANTIAAFKAGATCASVTINGLGERAGNAALEEVVMAMELSMKKPLGLNTSVFGEYQIISASTIGKAESDFIFGKHSGKASIKAFFKSRNISVSDNACENMSTIIKEQAQNLKRNLSVKEILSIYSGLDPVYQEI